MHVTQILGRGRITTDVDRKYGQIQFAIGKIQTLCRLIAFVIFESVVEKFLFMALSRVMLQGNMVWS